MAGATPDWIRPTPFEIATGTVVGPGGDELSPSAEPTSSPRHALEAAIRPALERSPCLVTFSGGRDSSAVLAVAVGLARRLGLAEPIPVTRRWPAYPATDESQWQELVITHLGIEHWERVAFEEMDVVGPACAASLAEHGPLWPPLIHTWPAIFELGRGGAILTGEGGDELFEVRRATPLRRVVAYPRAVSRPLVADLVGWAAPRPVRHRRLRAELRDSQPPWLRPQAARRWSDELLAWTLDEPYRWGPAVRRRVSDRGHRVGSHNLAVLAGRHGAALHHPLLSLGFVAALVGSAGPLGFPGRTSAMRALFGDLLPDAVLARTDKAYTDSVIFAASTRAFAREWNGAGLDPADVDDEAFRASLLGSPVHPGVALALQAAWRADRAPAAGPARDDR